MPAAFRVLTSGLAVGTQTVVISGAPTGGFLLIGVAFGDGTQYFVGNTAVPYNTTAAALQTALAALTGVGGGNVSVTGSAGGPFQVTFSGAAIDANGRHSHVIASASLLTGGAPKVTVTGSDVDIYTVPATLGGADVAGVKIAGGSLTNVTNETQVIGIGVTPAGSTAGLSFKSLFNYRLRPGDSLSLAGILTGDILGVGDKVSVYSTIPGGLSVKLTGAVVTA